MKYFFIAGEASGDLHAAPLMAALKERDASATFAFLGGDMMAGAAGVQPVIHYREMAFMGFSEVLRNLGAIGRNFKTARKALLDARPDCLVLIDYPSFNLKMAKFAKKHGIPVVYYISPKVWAWKQWRVKTIKKVVDRMLAIFPFEVDFYRNHGYEVEYVGNPSVDEIDRAAARTLSRQEFIAKYRLQDKPIVALLPGSRLNEIRRNMPIMVETMRRFPQYRGVVAGAPGVPRDFYAQFGSLPVVHGATYDLLANARAALVTSGTATLETALLGVPQVVMYRANGKKLSYDIMRRLLKVRHVSLPNLICGRTVIPEMLLHLCTPDTVAAELGRILPDRQARADMLDGYAEMRRLLTGKNAPQTAARAIADFLAGTGK